MAFGLLLTTLSNSFLEIENPIFLKTLIVIGKSIMEELSDPFLDDRVMKNVLPPPRFPMDHQKLFPKKNQPDWKALKSHLTKEGRLK